MNMHILNGVALTKKKSGRKIIIAMSHCVLMIHRASERVSSAHEEKEVSLSLSFHRKKRDVISKNDGICMCVSLCTQDCTATHCQRGQRHSKPLASLDYWHGEFIALFLCQLT
jgi:hypothetical protein